VVTALNARGGFFVGIDVGTGVGGFTYVNSQVLAARTRTTVGDGAGTPVVFGPGRAKQKLPSMASASGRVMPPWKSW
jgi:hypothetical protein